MLCQFIQHPHQLILYFSFLSYVYLLYIFNIFKCSLYIYLLSGTYVKPGFQNICVHLPPLSIHPPFLSSVLRPPTLRTLQPPQDLWPVSKCSADFFFPSCFECDCAASECSTITVRRPGHLCICTAKSSAFLHQPDSQAGNVFWRFTQSVSSSMFLLLFFIKTWKYECVSARSHARGSSDLIFLFYAVNSFHRPRLLLHCDWLSHTSICVLTHTQTHTLIGYYSQVQNPSEREAIVNQARLRCKTNVLSVLQPRVIEMQHGWVCMFF